MSTQLSPEEEKEIYYRVLEQRFARMKMLADKIVTQWDAPLDSNGKWHDRIDKLCKAYAKEFLPAPSPSVLSVPSVVK